jgi:UDP-3-O-[3-hydroxymyristoyl] glucosamine N-acyltransferase
VLLGQSGVSKSLKGGKTYFGSPAAESRKRMQEMAQLSRFLKTQNKE